MSETGELDFDVTGLAATTVVTVRALWAEMGIPSDEQESLLAGLVHSARSVFSKFSEEQAAQKQSIIDFIATAQEKCAAMAKSMHLQEEEVEKDDMKLIETQKAYETRLSELDRIHSKRDTELTKLHTSLVELHKSMNTEISTEFLEVGTKLTLQRISEFKAVLAEQQSEAISRREQVDSMTAECATLLTLTGEEVEHPLTSPVTEEGAGAGSLGIATETISALQQLQGTLLAAKARREGVISELGGDIARLWERLSTPEGDRDAFRAAHDGLDDGVIAAVQDYLTGLQVEYTARLGELVQGLRSRIAEAQAGIMLGEGDAAAEFGDCMAMAGENITEELLEKHEEYLSSLNERAEAMAPLLRGVERRATLLADKAEWETIVADPNRLLSRGRRGADRLREEKLERRVRKELPAVTAKLRAAALAWEEANGKHFCVQGARLVESLDDAAAAEEAKKEEAKNKRKTAAADCGSSTGSRSNSNARSSVMSARAPPAPGSRAGSGMRARKPSAAGGSRRGAGGAAAGKTAGAAKGGSAAAQGGARKPRVRRSSAKPATSENSAPVDAAAAGKAPKSKLPMMSPSQEPTQHLSSAKVHVSTASKNTAKSVLAALGDSATANEA